MQTDEERKAKERERWRLRYVDPEREPRSEFARANVGASVASSIPIIAGESSSDGSDDTWKIRQPALILRTNAAYRRRNWERLRERRQQISRARMASEPLYRVHLSEQMRRYRRKQRRERDREFLAAVREAIPASCPRDVRDDIASDMILAVAERRLRRDRIREAVSSFVRSYWQRNPRMGFVSLDAPIYAGGPRLVDTIAGDLSRNISYRLA